MLHTALGLLAFSALSAYGNASPSVSLRGSNSTQDRVAGAARDSLIRIDGLTANKVESFLNIRFGESTSGNNRFAPPKAFTYPGGTRVNATSAGAACPQPKVPEPDFPLFDNVTKMSEDCLNLRVDRPVGTAANAKLPVMVYIYGGGDSFGQVYDSAYAPAGLVANSANLGYPVIYVAMNYRVGVFGFAASPALRAADSLNVGLLDQRLALEWVQENIAAFGGDPDNVTIFGESDGGTGVGLQITAYGGNAKSVPFKRAIMQSGSALGDPGTASNFSAVHTAQVVKKAKCTSSSSTEELACLRKLPMETLRLVSIDVQNADATSGMDVFIPTSPSTFIPDSPSKLLTDGRFSKNIDLITGWNENDGSLATSPYINSTATVAAFLKSQFPAFSKQNIEKALALYPVSSFAPLPSEGISAQYFRASQIQRDSQFSCPSLHQLQMNQKYSDAGTTNYLFALNQTIFSTAFALYNASFYGVSHMSDIPFVFNQAKTKYAELSTASDVKLASQMSGSWASFAAYGNPSKGNGSISGWSDAKDADDQYKLQVIGGLRAGIRTIGTGADTYEALAKRCAFWNSPEVFEQMEV
ncbi:uncharacterized protein N7459_004056 [Penicillium hispanicum]|uniref:uncharacterized protein n=1 Tax=Penicillium hispanicum TaxID=1080232 RepID=UPI0025423F77|nr:uncharacterized protein N7459_004056 [Penicillium hispanicum]KAJ5584256.1 hypothetical protein N7459_004056 [Penicillium hispanicum]